MQSYENRTDSQVFRSKNFLHSEIFSLKLYCHIFTPQNFRIKTMAKVQSFADKAKGKKKVEGVTVKVIKSMKTDGGAYKFNEKFVKLADISKVTDIK